MEDRSELLKHHAPSIHHLRNCRVPDPQNDRKGSHHWNRFEDGPFGPTSDQLNPSEKKLQPLQLQLIFDLKIPSSPIALDLKLKLCDPSDLFCDFPFRLSIH